MEVKKVFMPMEKINDTPKIKEKPEAKKRKIQGVIKDEFRGLQDRMNRIPKKLKEMLTKNSVDGFFDKLFGKKSKVGTFLSVLTTTLAEKFSIIKSKLSWEEFKNQLSMAAKDTDKMPFDLDEYIVAHRALGYGRHKENSEEAIIAAIKGGEKQIEIDLRWGSDGKIYLSHDPIMHIKNPDKHFLELKKALTIFAKDIHQDIVIFFDIKEEGIVEELDIEIDKVDEEFKEKRAYRKIKNRHFIIGFNFKILKKARKLNKNRPLIFCYIPLNKLKGMAKLIEKLGQDKMISICEVLDKFSGEHLALDLSQTRVSINNKKISETNENGESIVDIFTTLPPEEILNTVDYVCIPAVLAFQQMVKKLHSKGVRVAVWGASGKYIQEAIVESGADLVITG